MANWYGIYETSSKDVKGAGFFAEPENVDTGTGNALTEAQAGEIPHDLIAEDGSSNYSYDPDTHKISHK